MIGILSLGVVVFLIGIVQNFGYTGTTPVRKMLETDWNSFKSKTVAPDESGAKAGSPFYFTGEEPIVEGGAANFDSRLAKILTYLAGDHTSSTPACGFAGQHEAIGISIDASQKSDLSHPQTTVESTSTLFRGVGLRFAFADRVKCIQVCPNPTGPNIVTLFNSPGFNIPLDGKPIQGKPAGAAGCSVYCAVDYYPNGVLYGGNPTPADPRDLVPPRSALELQLLNPSNPLNTLGLACSGFLPCAPGDFSYDSPAFSNFDKATRWAGIYKTAQLAYELFHVDDKGCAAKDGNTGGKRMIPYTIIFPEWVWSSSGFSDNDIVKVFNDLAEKSFPFSLQSESPLAGTAYDPLLTIGIHLNY